MPNDPVNTRVERELLRSQSRRVQHLYMALTQKNLQRANVISDIVGAAGQKILRAIVAGERHGLTLATLKDARIKARTNEIAQSLQGSWRAEHLFAPKQALAVHTGDPQPGKKRRQLPRSG